MSDSRGNKLPPLRAKYVEIRDGGGTMGAGIDGFVIGAGIQVVVVGASDRTTESAIRKRVERVIRDHIDEIVAVDDSP